MNITAQYTPPPKQSGSITLTVPEDLAQKLRALLGRCNGDDFTAICRSLETALPASGRLVLIMGATRNENCISVSAAEGAKFTPVHPGL